MNHTIHTTHHRYRFTFFLLSVVMISISGCSLLSVWQDAAVQITHAEARAVGDPARGEILFTRGKADAPACTNCHALEPSMFSLGPTLVDVHERASQRVEGLSSAEYLHQSIVEPGAYVVTGFRNIMYGGYGTVFTESELADLIAYLETL